MAKKKILKPCPITLCKDKCESHHLMCKRHWFMVAPELRDRIWSLFGQSDMFAEHQAACREALRFVMKKERSEQRVELSKT